MATACNRAGNPPRRHDKHQGLKQRAIHGEASIRRRRIGRLSLRGARAKPAPTVDGDVERGRLRVPERDTEMAIREQKVHGLRWRLLVGTVALGAASLGLSSGVLAGSASADEAPSGTAIVQCTSGTVTNGDVQTSSSFVAKVPAGTHAELP